MLPRVHIPHVRGAPGFADGNRLFHLAPVVSQNGFQLSTHAMSDRLFALRLFARVARKGSFSAAGRELNIPQSTASRTIATLEREIGVALFVRTTRAVTLTDAGLDFLARIESVLAELDEAEHAARGTGEMRGILRIGLATNFAVREVISRLSDFMSRHPALRIELMMGDSAKISWPKAWTSRFGLVLFPTRQRRCGEFSHGRASSPRRELTSTRPGPRSHLRIWPSMRSFLGPQALAATGPFARAIPRPRSRSRAS